MVSAEAGDGQAQVAGMFGLQNLQKKSFLHGEREELSICAYRIHPSRTPTFALIFCCFVTLKI